MAETSNALDGATMTSTLSAVSRSTIDAMENVAVGRGFRDDAAPAQRFRELDVPRRIDQDDVGVVALAEDPVDGRGHGPGHEVADPETLEGIEDSAHATGR